MHRHTGVGFDSAESKSEPPAILTVHWFLSLLSKCSGSAVRQEQGKKEELQGHWLKIPEFTSRL